MRLFFFFSFLFTRSILSEWVKRYRETFNLYMKSCMVCGAVKWNTFELFKFNEMKMVWNNENKTVCEAKTRAQKKLIFALPISRNYRKMIEELCPISHRQIVISLENYSCSMIPTPLQHCSKFFRPFLTFFIVSNQFLNCIHQICSIILHLHGFRSICR